MKEWICAPCGHVFSTSDVAGFDLAPPACPRCARPAHAVSGGVACANEAPAQGLSPRSRGPQIVSGLMAGVVLAVVYALVDAGLGALEGAEAAWLDGASRLGHGAFTVLWTALNGAGALRPG